MIDKKLAHHLFFVHNNLPFFLRGSNIHAHVSISDSGKERFNKIQDEIYKHMRVPICQADVIDYLLSVHDRHVKNLEE